MFETPAGPVPVLITLGSNIAPETNLPRAVWMLRQNHHLIVRAVSRVYESAPINAAGEIAPGQGRFLNAAVWIETDYYSAFSLKYNVLRFVEKCLGRARTADKFAPRPIDLDIALYGDRVIDDPHLSVPDPDILRRAHVALPLADLAPAFVHPVTGQTLATIAAPFQDTAAITVRGDIHLDLST
jgi:2-amino-4-hydroxy-6-hydroxymethyldihydropteridine diphosphokinase